MKISEISPDLRPSSGDRRPPPLVDLLANLESLVSDAESLSSSSSANTTSQEKLASEFRRLLSLLSSSSSSLSDASKLHLWKLAFRLWNSCVDLSNSAAIAAGGVCGTSGSRYGEAELRQAAAELLLLSGAPAGVPSAAAKTASFFHRAGLIWHELVRLDLAAACLEKATSLISGGGGGAAGDEERRLLLDLNIARARVAWDASDQTLAVALLSRSKPLAAGYPTAARALAEQYLHFGKLVLSTKPSDPTLQSSDLLSQALDLCEKAISAGGAAAKTLDLAGLKCRCLRFLAAERLQAEDYEGVLRCIGISRDSENAADGEHPSIGFMAIRAWLGAGIIGEAERELERLMANGKAAENVCVSAAEDYLAVAGPKAAQKVLLALAARCHAGGAAAAVRVVRRVVDGGGSSTGRARAVAELVSDERVVALFEDVGNARERGTMHALLWNCGTEHFRSKNYDTSAELFERSMLYVPRDEESRCRRANCFRVLALCHLALAQLDRAQEFADEANKLEPNVKCAFLKFKIHLQKNEEEEAMKQMQTMVGCIDFNPEFLTLSTHEAIACKSGRVAVASLIFLLGLYSPGKPMPMPEVAVLRNLIALLLREPGTEAEILKYSRCAQLRMADLGVEGFFGKGAVASRELTWFAGNSWNMGLKTGKENKFEFCADFFELAAEFYNTSDDENEGNQPMVCKSLILSVSAMVNAEELRKSPLPDSDIKKGIEMLSRASKLLPSISAPVACDQSVNSSLLFLHTCTCCQLLSRMDINSHSQQLQIIKSFATSKSCTPRHLLQLGLTASQGACPNFNAAEFALKACLTALLASHSPDYDLISIALRKLACLASFQDSDGGKNDGAYNIYRQAYQIVVGLKGGEYPVEEGKWLAMTAWNKAGLAVRLQQAAIARRWMKMGLDLARHLKGMEQYIAGMEECFGNFEKICGDEPGECGQVYGSQSGSMSQPVLV